MPVSLFLIFGFFGLVSLIYAFRPVCVTRDRVFLFLFFIMCQTHYPKQYNDEYKVVLILVYIPYNLTTFHTFSQGKKTVL